MAQQPPVSWQAPYETYGPAPGVRFAGLGARFIAYLVDGFVLGVLITLVTIVYAALMAGAFAGAASSDTPGTFLGPAAGGTLLFLIVTLLLGLAYFPWFWARGGQTPGMKLLSIRVVRDIDGGAVSGGAAVLRLIGFWVSSWVLYLGFIWIFIDKRRRGWHDLLAGTVVIEWR
jgi:uncharacterized RDD family membrane protein YckC